MVAELGDTQAEIAQDRGLTQEDDMDELAFSLDSVEGAVAVGK
jgi:hypothetical protein